jgi:hypothetical protein
MKLPKKVMDNWPQHTPQEEVPPSHRFPHVVGAWAEARVLNHRILCGSYTTLNLLKDKLQGRPMSFGTTQAVPQGVHAPRPNNPPPQAPRQGAKPQQASKRGRLNYTTAEEIPEDVEVLMGTLLINSYPAIVLSDSEATLFFHQQEIHVA